MIEAIIEAVLILALVAVIAIIANKVEDSKRSKDFISFRESLDLAELPVVTFYQGDIKLNLLLDTGANKSVLDMTAAMPLEVEKTNKVSDFAGIGGGGTMTPIVSVIITYKGKEFEEEFQVANMQKIFSKIKETTGVTIHGMLGNGFMQKYKYILDFDEMVAYYKK